MILFNNAGPCLLYVSDYTNWFPLGYCQETPIVKRLDRYQPIPSASSGETNAASDDESFEGQDAFIDATMNLYDDRLVSFITASPKYNLLTNSQQQFSAMPPQAAIAGGVGIANRPLPPVAGLAQGNRQPGVFDRRDFGSLMSRQNASFPLCIYNLKFHTDYPNYLVGQPLGNRCPPPGYTFFQVKAKTFIDQNTEHGPTVKRAIFEANQYTVDFGNQSIFRFWNRKKASSYPTQLLDLNNYYLDNSYMNSVSNLAVIQGGKVLYVPGVPRGLIVVDPSSFFKR